MISARHHRSLEADLWKQIVLLLTHTLDPMGTISSPGGRERRPRHVGTADAQQRPGFVSVKVL